ncbi:hypothetical protein HAX54_010501 [Datura stramonium]|uniref:Protein transport protein Sec61 subunit beta n=1 Tax=Datura stramonium TaxID=4076 RepID=A0ABS8TJ21_DATST|nr:hypothetical protein [Datura stramonium]
MALGGGGPQRGTAAANAANLRRRKTGGGGGSAGGAGGTMLQFYTDDSPGLKISPNVVLVMSIGFIAFVAILHVMERRQILVFLYREWDHVAIIALVEMILLCSLHVASEQLMLPLCVPMMVIDML